MHRFWQPLAVSALLLGAIGCSPGDGAPGAASTPRADGSGEDGPAAAPDAPARTARDSALQAAAEGVVAFLRGEADYESLNLADSVDLLIPAEGGGTRHRVAREELRDRSAWVVRTGAQRYSFVPHADFIQMTVAPGRHVNCLEGPLNARVPEFAASPHVGVRMAPPAADGCLQGWNATFVFDTIPHPPRLTAAIYDQWEW